jgi:AraC-like DNA-binding protein
MPKYHLNKSFFQEPAKFSDIYIMQIGRLYFEPGAAMPLHIHKNFYYELTIVTEGEGEISANGVNTRVKRGDIFLSLPCDMHRIVSSESSPMKYDFVSFYTTNEIYRTELENISRYLSPADRVFRDERIHALVCDAIMEFIESPKFSNELLHSIFTQIIIYIIRDVAEGTKARTRYATQAEAICYQLMNYIDTHIHSISKLEDVAEIMNYNYSYLSALFKKTAGCTLLSYYHQKRLEAARQLITEGTLKITEIAEMLNYSSLYSFSRAFKETFGVSPKQYEKQKKEDLSE